MQIPNYLPDGTYVPRVGDQWRWPKLKDGIQVGWKHGVIAAVRITDGAWRVVISERQTADLEVFVRVQVQVMGGVVRTLRKKLEEYKKNATA